MSALRALLVAIALSLSACSQTRPTQVATSVDAVIADEESLLDRAVVIRGYLRFGDDSRNLWSTEHAYRVIEGHISRGELALEDPNWKRCITLYGVGEWRDLLLKRSGDYVVVKGVLRRYASKWGEISLGACSDLGVEIGSIQDR